MSKRILFTLSLVAIFCYLCFSACTKKSLPNEVFMEATVNGTLFSMNYCQIYQPRPASRNWNVVGKAYKPYKSGSPVFLYPRVELCLTKFEFTTGTHNIGTDSVTAYYYPSPTDTVQAISGVINVSYIFPRLCGGIKGTFSLILKDGTVITDGKFVTSAYCGTM